MRWEDERYVRVYTRDTGEWLALGWEAQALFLFALRKADRAGIVRTGKAGARGLAGMTGIPLDVVARSLPLLLDDGCVRECDGGYIIPNFIAAQEVPISDAQRKRDQRERDRDKAMAEGGPIQRSAADIGARMSRTEVTPEGHVLGHARRSRQKVTPEGHVGSVTPSLAVPSRADPSQDLSPSSSANPREELRLESPKVPRRRKAPAEKPPGDPRHAPLTKELCEVHGWPHHGGRTGVVITRLLQLAAQAGHAGDAAPREVLRRAAEAKAQGGFPRVRELHELEKLWGHFAAHPETAEAEPLRFAQWAQDNRVKHLQAVPERGWEPVPDPEYQERAVALRGFAFITPENAQDYAHAFMQFLADDWPGENHPKRPWPLSHFVKNSDRYMSEAKRAQGNTDGEPE